QEGVDGDEDGVEPVPLDRYQVILYRQNDEEGRRQREVIAATGRNQRQELAQRGEGREQKQRDDPALAERERHRDGDNHHPPRLVLAVRDRQRRSERHRAQERNRYKLALGHDAVQVLDPYRHELDVRPRPGEVVEAGFERQQTLLGRVARALRKDDEREALG